MIIKIELDTSSYDMIDPMTTSHQIISNAIDRMHSSVPWPLYGSKLAESFLLTNEFGGVTTVVGRVEVTK